VLMSSCKRACHYCTCTATAPFLQLVRRGRRASSSARRPRIRVAPSQTRPPPTSMDVVRPLGRCTPAASRHREAARASHPRALRPRVARAAGVAHSPTSTHVRHGWSASNNRLRKGRPAPAVVCVARRRVAALHMITRPALRARGGPWARRPRSTARRAGATTRGVGTRVGRRRRRRRPLRGGSAAHRATTATAVGVGARQGWWRQWHDAGGGAAARAAGRAAAPLAPRNVRRALRRRAARGVARRHPRGRQARLAVPHRAAPRRAKGARRLFDALYCMRHGSKALHVLSKLGEAGLGYSTQRSSNSKTWHQWRRLAGLPTGSSNSTTTRGGGPVRQPSTRLRAFVRVTTPR